MIVFDRVWFGYAPGIEVICDLSLEVGPGLTLVVGKNGCGKSTLLKLAAGVEKPGRGVVSIAGYDLWRDEVAARRHLAYLPEHPDLTPYATVAEILDLVCGLRSQPPAAARDALTWAGLDRLDDRTVRELSKGQRRRATLAAARVGSPEWLLLDEPLEGMDRSFRVEVVDWVRERLAAGASALVVSHDFESLEPYAVRAVTVQEGRALVVDPLPPSEAERIQALERLAKGLPHDAVPRG